MKLLAPSSTSPGSSSLLAIAPVTVLAQVPSQTAACHITPHPSAQHKCPLFPEAVAGPPHWPASCLFSMVTASHQLIFYHVVLFYTGSIGFFFNTQIFLFPMDLHVLLKAWNCVLFIFSSLHSTVVWMPYKDTKHLLNKWVLGLMKDHGYWQVSFIHFPIVYLWPTLCWALKISEWAKTIEFLFWKTFEV